MLASAVLPWNGVATAILSLSNAALAFESTTYQPFSKPMAPAPGGTTHYKLISGGGAIGFENGWYVVDSKASAVLPWNGVATAILSLSNAAPLASTHPLFLLFGIEFYQEVNGIQYPLKNGAYNALSVVKVSGV